MAITQSELTALYLSYFGRPPDPGGMAFYLNQPDATVQSVAAAFSASPESMDLIGPVFGADQVDRIYMNLFGRHAESDGLTYWTKQVADGLMTPAFAAYGIFLGAQNADLISVQNKMLVATTFLQHLDLPEEIAGYAGHDASIVARGFMDTVGASASSLASAMANVDTAIAAMIAAATTDGPTYAYFGSNPIEEGRLYYVTIQTTGIAPGVVLNWSITGVDPSDMEGALSGTVTVDANGKVLLALEPLIDMVDDGGEVMTLTVGGGVFDITINESSGPLFDSYLVNFTLKGNNHVWVNGVDTGSADYTSKNFSDVLTVGGTTTVGSVLAFKDVTLSDKADLTMAVATYNSFMAATLTAAGGQTIHFTDAFSGTLSPVIEAYGLASVSGNDATLGTAAQNVTGGSDDDIVRTGALTAPTGTLDGGSQTTADSLYVTTTGTNLTGATITNFEAINLDTDVNATMTVAQANLLNLAAGTNTVTLNAGGTVTGAAAVEAYVLADATGNDFTLGSGTQTVTGSASQDDVFRTGSVTSYTGTINAGGQTGVDKLIVSPAGSDISGATLNGIEEIDLDTGASATMTLSQHGILNTSAGTNTVTFTDAGAVTGKSDVESYVLADATGNDFTLGASAQNVTGSNTQDDTIRTGSITSVTGTLDAGGQTGNDQLIISTTGTDISGATTTGFEQIHLSSSVNAKMTIAQNALIATGAGTNTVTLSDAGTATGAAVVENYQLSSAGANDFTMGAGSQNVTGGTADDVIHTGAATSITGTIDGGAHTTGDTLDITTTATNISTATVTNIEAITLQSGVSATMTIAENALVTTAAGTNTITLTNAGTATGAAQVESYILADATGNDFTLGASAQNVTGSANNDDIVRTGAITSVTGTLSVGLNTADQLVISTTGTNISTATLSGFEQINLDNNVSATMTIAENALVNTAAGTNTITLTDAGTATGAAAVENYQLANGTNTFTVGSTSQNVTGGTGADTVKAAGTLTGTYSLAGGTDILELTANSNIVGATLTAVEQINLDTNVNATMTIAQNALVNLGAGTNTITLNDAGSTTGAKAIENYILKDAAGNDFTLGANGQNVTGGATASDIVRTGAITNVTGTIALGGGTDQLIISTDGTKIFSAALTGVEQINLDTDVGATMTIAQNTLVNTGTGTNTITLSDSGSTTGAAQVESYVLNNGSGNDFTLGAAAQNVSGSGNKDDIVRTGAITAPTGTIDLGNGNDTLILTADNTDISGATLTSVETISLGSGFNAKMTAQQNATPATVTIAGAGNNTITLTTAGTTTGAAAIENYILKDATGNDFTLGATAQNVTGSANQNDIVRTGTLTSITGTLDGGGQTTADQLVITTTGTSISGATITNFEQINLDTDVSITLTVAQHALLNTAAGTNTVTLSDTGTVTGKATVETYSLANGAGNIFTVGSTSQNVVGGTGNDLVKSAGTLASGTTYNLGAGTDTLEITGTANIAAATLTSVETINLDSGVSLTMTAAQHADDASNIGTADSTNTIVFSTATTTDTGKSTVGTYSLSSAGANTFVVGSTSQNVTGGTAADTVKASGTLTGTYNLGGGTDALQLTGNSDITGATIDVSVEQLNLNSGVSVTMKAAQHAIVNTLGGSNTITFTDAFTSTGKSGVSTYNLADVTGNSFTLGAGTGAQTINASANQNDTVNTGTVATVTATINFGATSTGDTLVTGANTNISGATLNDLDKIDVASTTGVTMTRAQNALITAGAGTGNIVILTDAGSATGASVVEAYTLANAAGNVFTLGANSQAVTGASGFADTVNTGTATTLGTATYTMGGTGTDVLNINATIDVSGATISSFEQINLDASVVLTMTAAQHADNASNIGTAFSTDTIVFTTATTTDTGSASVGTYSLSSAGANTFTVGSTSQNVTGGTNNDTVKVSGTLTGTYSLGSGTDALQLQSGSNNITGATLNSVEQINLNSGANVTMLASQHSLVNTIGGSNTITFADAFSGAGKAVSAYVLADASGNDLTLGAAAQKVTGTGTQDDIVRTGALATVSGALDFGAGTGDTLVITNTATDISGATLSNLENITLGNSSATMTRAQNALITSATGGANTVTLTDGGLATGFVDVEAYVLANAAGNIFILGAAGQKVTGSGNNDDTVRTGAMTSVTGTIDLGNGNGDALEVTTFADISGATLTSVEKINLALDADVKMVYATQHSLLSGVLGDNTVTFTDVVTTAVGNSGVESYVLADGTNTFTVGSTSQNVTGGTGDDTIKAAGTLTATYDGAAGTDTLELTATSDISGATLTSIEKINLDSNVGATMKVAQHTLVNAGTGTNTITFTDGGAVTGSVNIETYVLANASGNDFTLATASQAVTGTATQNDIVRAGSLASITGSGINLGAGGTDQLVISSTTGTDISAATVGGVELLTLDTNAKVTMTITQHTTTFPTISAAGGNTVTFTTAGTVTGNAGVASYVLAAGTNTFTVGSASQNVTGSTGADTVKASGTLTGTYDLAAGANIFELTSTSDLTGATFLNASQTTINIDAGDVTMKASQPTIGTAAGTNQVTYTTAGSIVGSAQVETYVLADSAGNAFTLGAGTGAQTITASDSQDDTVNTGTVSTVTATINFGATSTGDKLVIGANTDIKGATLNDLESIDLGNFNATMKIAQHALITAAAGGANVVTLSDAGTFDANSAVESYVLSGSGANNIKLTANQSVTGQAGVSDVVDTGTQTTISGAISLGTGDTDQLYVRTDGTTISGATLTSVEQIVLNTGVGVIMTTTQHGTTGSGIVGDSTNTITFSTAAAPAVTGNASIGKYVLSSAGANSFTVGSTSQSVTGGTNNDTVTAGGTLMGAYNLGSGTDTFVLSANSDITGATVSNMGTLNMNSKTISMLASQHSAFTAVSNAAAITFTDKAASVTGLAGATSYILADVSGNDFKLGATSGQTVTGATNWDTIVRTGAAGTYSNTINYSAAATADQLVISNTGTNISSMTLNNVDQINLDGIAALTLNVTQNLKVNSATGSNTITLSNAGTTTGAAAIENYNLAAGTNTFTLGASGQGVLGSGTNVDTIKTGSLTSVTGLVDGAGGNDVFIIEADCDISTANFNNNMEAVKLDGISNVTMSVTQHALITSATGTNTITFSVVASGNANSAIENYKFGDFANVFTTNAVAQNVTGGALVDTVTAVAASTGNYTLGAGNDVLTISGTVTGTLDLGADSDTLKLGAASNVSGATLSGIETINMNSKTLTMTASQHNAITTFSSVAAMTISDATATTVIANSAITSYTLSNAGNDSISFAGTDAVRASQSVIVSGAGTDTITVNNVSYEANTNSAVTVASDSFVPGTGTGYDIFLAQLNGTAYNGGYMAGSSGTPANISGLANYSVLLIANAGTTNLNQVGDGQAVENVIAAAISNFSGSNTEYLAVVYSSSNGTTADAGIFAVHITNGAGGTNLASGDFTIEKIGVLNSVGADTLVHDNFGV